MNSPRERVFHCSGEIEMRLLKTMKQLVKKLLRRSGYQISNLQIRHRDIFADKEFAEVYAKAQESTATPVIAQGSHWRTDRLAPKMPCGSGPR